MTQVSFALLLVLLLQPCLALSQEWADRPLTLCVQALQKGESMKNRQAIFRERFIAPLVEFAEVATTATSPMDAAKKLIATDYRGSIFRIEGLMRLYKNETWAEPITELREQMKALEDALGRAVDGRKHVKLALEIGLSPRAIEILVSDEKAFLQGLADLLVKDQWLGAKPGMIADYLARVDAVEFPSQAENQGIVEKRFKKEAKDILDADFDMKDLQGGVHELRRKIRWFLIEIHALRGLVQIVADKSVPKRLKDYQTVAEEAKKYMAVPETALELKHPVELSQADYYTLSYFVEWFGRIKDRGEIREYFLDAVSRSGEFKDEAAAEAYLIPLLEKTMQWTDFYPESKTAFKALLKSEILEHLP